jgi:hypothetical protein
MILTLIIVFMGRTTPINDFPGFVIAEADGKVLSISAPSDLPPEARLDATFSKAHFKTMGLQDRVAGSILMPNRTR